MGESPRDFMIRRDQIHLSARLYVLAGRELSAPLFPIPRFLVLRTGSIRF